MTNITVNPLFKPLRGAYLFQAQLKFVCGEGGGGGLIETGAYLRGEGAVIKI